MGMNSDEIQYVLDRRGSIEIPSGSIITTPIELAHLQGRVRISCEDAVTYAGPPGRWAFEWNWKPTYNHTQCHLSFVDVDFSRGGVDHGGFVKINAGVKSPKSLTVINCNVSSVQAYSIDANNVPYIDSVYMRDIKSSGCCAVRWIGETANANGWFKIKNFRHQGGDRVGAAFYFENLRNVTREKLIDEGSPELLSSLKTVYVGPISSVDCNCLGYNFLHDLWSEPWGSWATLAPACWPFELRSDSTSGDHGSSFVVYKNVTASAGGVEDGVALFQIYGGHNSTGASALRVDLDDVFALRDYKVKFAGKSMAVANRSMVAGLFSADDINKFNNANSGSWRDYWRSASSVLPLQDSADQIFYGPSDNKTNYTSIPPQYDD